MPVAPQAAELSPEDLLLEQELDELFEQADQAEQAAGETLPPAATTGPMEGSPAFPPTAPTSSTAAGSAQAVFSFVTARPATLANKPICKDCRMEVDPMKPGTRLTKKSVQQYQCSRCNTKCVLMNRMCGSWPTDEFLELSAEQQVEFYRTPGGSKDFKKKYVETMIAC